MSAPGGLESVSAPAASRHVWLMVAVLFCSTLLIQGTALAGVTLFDARIMHELDITRSVLKFRDLIYILTASFSCLFMAQLCERFGARTMVAIGLGAFSLVMLGYAVAHSVALIYLSHALLGFAYACVHVVVLMVILARWFDADDPRRGIALGICISGASCGAIATSQAIAALLVHLPWRSVFLVLAAVPVAIVPFTVAIRTPHDDRRGDWSIGAQESLGFSFRMLASGPAIAMMLAIVPIFYVSACIGSHTALMLRGQGLALSAVAGGVSAFFTAALAGKFGSGFLLLRFRLQTAWLLAMGLMVVGSAVLLAAPRIAYLPALALLGLGWGGAFPLAQLKIGEIFPGEALTRVLGAFVVFESIGAASGAWLTALMYDASGAYTLPFAINLVLLAVGFLASIAIHRHVVRRTPPVPRALNI